MAETYGNKFKFTLALGQRSKHFETGNTAQGTGTVSTTALRYIGLLSAVSVTPNSCSGKHGMLQWCTWMI